MLVSGGARLGATGKQASGAGAFCEGGVGPRCPGRLESRSHVCGAAPWHLVSDETGQLDLLGRIVFVSQPSSSNFELPSPSRSSPEPLMAHLDADAATLH